MAPSTSTRTHRTLEAVWDAAGTIPAGALLEALSSSARAIHCGWNGQIDTTPPPELTLILGDQLDDTETFATQEAAAFLDIPLLVTLEAAPDVCAAVLAHRGVQREWALSPSQVGLRNALVVQEVVPGVTYVPATHDAVLIAGAVITTEGAMGGRTLGYLVPTEQLTGRPAAA